MNERLRWPLVRRGLVTAGVCAGLAALRYVPLPGVVDYDYLSAGEMGGFSGASLSLGSLGATPWLSAFALVELASLATPGLRARRIAGPQARAPLDQAVSLLWLILALVFGSLRASFLLRTDAFYPGLGLSHTLVLAATLTAASGLWLLGARVVASHGVGSPWPIFLMVPLVGPLLTALRLPDLFTDQYRSFLVWVLGLLVLLVFGGRRLLRAWTPEGVPVMSSGLVHLEILTIAPILVPYVDPSWLAPAIAVLACLGIASAYAHLFHRPGNVAPALGISPSAARAALKRTLPVVYLVTIVSAGIQLLSQRQGLGPTWINVLVLAQAATMAWDLWGEWQLRAAQGELVAVRSYQQVYAVQPALRLLDEAGIPRCARALRFRQVVQFFAPYAPIEILVPAARAAEARDVLTRLPTAALPDPPTPSTATSWGGPWFTPGGER